MLEQRLKPLANKLKAAIAKGETEANSRGMFYSGQAVITSAHPDVTVEAMHANEAITFMINRAVNTKR